MTIEIKGAVYKITLTQDELKALRNVLPYQLINLIGKAESDPGGYADEGLKLPEVHSSYGSDDYLTGFMEYKPRPEPTGKTLKIIRYKRLALPTECRFTEGEVAKVYPKLEYEEVL